jgi:GNAT superfamily N-acetyltransferase
VELIIRQLCSHDAPDIFSLSQLVDEFVTTDKEDRWSISELSDWLANSSDYCVGAFSDGSLIGFCLSHFHKESNKVHLENIFVRSDFRRHGVGSSLIETLVAFYRANNDKHLRYVGLVQSGNANAQSFFQNVGFNRGLQVIWFQR